MPKIRDEYLAKAKLQIEELNRKVDALEEKSDEVRAELRESYYQDLIKLRQHASQAADKLRQIKTAGGASWDKLVQEMDRFRDAFAEALERFKSKF